MWGDEGGEAGEFWNPHGIAIGERGEIYIADLEGHRIQKFDADGVFITAWGKSGRAAGEFDSPRDIALDNDENVYVADFRNHRIQVFDSNGRFQSAWGQRGTSLGELYLPVGLAISGRRMFVADLGQRVQRFDLAGNFETGWSLYDGSVEEFPDLFGLDVDPEGCVWVAERNQHRVRRFDPNGRLLATWDQQGAVPGAFQGPISIAVDRRGHVLVGNSEDNRVQIFDSNGRFLVQWIPRSVCSLPYHPAPIGIAVSTDDRIYLLSASGKSVLEFVVPSHTTARSWWAWGANGFEEGGLYHPLGIAVADNLVYVSDQLRRVQVFTPEGDFLHSVGSSGLGENEFRSPRGITTFGDLIYVTDAVDPRVHAFERSGQWIRSWRIEDGPTGQLAFPNGIATDRLGNIYVCATRARVDVFDPDGSLLRSWGELGSGPGQFRAAAAVTVSDAGIVYVSDTSLRRVMRFDLNGTFLGDLAELSTFGSPMALDTSASEHVFVSTPAHILQYAADGTLLATWGSSGACERQFAEAGGVAVDTQGRVFVTDVGNDRVHVFVPPYTGADHTRSEMRARR